MSLSDLVVQRDDVDGHSAESGAGRLGLLRGLLRRLGNGLLLLLLGLHGNLSLMLLLLLLLLQLLLGQSSSLTARHRRLGLLPLGAQLLHLLGLHEAAEGTCADDEQEVDGRQ